MAKPIKLGDEFNYSAPGYPNILITSGDEAIMSVNNATRTLTALSTGIVFITVQDVNNSNIIIDQFSFIVKEDDEAIGRLFGTGAEKGRKIERTITKLN